MRYLLVFLLVLCGCASDDRAKVAADARAGIHAAAEVAPEAAPILAGVDARLPAVSGVNSADWPAAEWTKERIKADVKGYAESAPPEPARWGFWAAVGGAGVAALGLLRIVAPLIPGGGPIVKMAADFAWTVMSTKDQKAADQAAAMAQQAAQHVGPILDAIKTLPPGTLPAHVQQMLDVPIVRAAVEHLAKR
jgi:hypothetical protein